MNMKLVTFCVGCSLILGGVSLAGEPDEAPAILSALGQQAGVAVVSEAELAEIEGTGWLPRWHRSFRRSVRAFFRANRAQRRRIIRMHIAWIRAQRNGGGGGEVPGGGGGGTEPPEMAE